MLMRRRVEPSGNAPDRSACKAKQQPSASDPMAGRQRIERCPSVLEAERPPWPATCSRIDSGGVYRHVALPNFASSADSRTTPVAEQSLLSRFPHPSRDDLPRSVGHVSAHKIAANATRDHVGFGVPDAVVDTIQAHPKRLLPAVDAASGDGFGHEVQSKIVGTAQLPISLSRISENRSGRLKLAAGANTLVYDSCIP